MILSFALLAALLYALAAWCIWRPHATQPWLVLAAVLAHAVGLSLQVMYGGVLRIGISEALSLFAWQSAALLWAFSFREPLRVLGLAVYPLAAALALFAAALPSAPSNHMLDDWKASVHVLVSMLSAGLLTLAAVQTLALALQDRLLHRHDFGPLLARLPPLQTMERLLFQLVAVGFALLSLTLLTGLWFVRDWLSQHLAHKTVLSITAWVIFGVLLWGRARHGWRGRTAIRWALSGYATLLLAYFGSKLVLEQILSEHWNS